MLLKIHQAISLPVIPAKAGIQLWKAGKKGSWIPDQVRDDAGPKGVPPQGRASFDLGFLELDVLARDGVIFAEAHLLGDVPRVLLGHVEEAGVGGADELDLDRGRFGHDGRLLNLEKRKRRNRRPACRAPLPWQAPIVKGGTPESRRNAWLTVR